jgi:peptide methionine sulfoxide reductase msrA/msrB
MRIYKCILFLISILTVLICCKEIKTLKGERIMTSNNNEITGKNVESGRNILKKELTSLQFNVTCDNGTEQPFNNEYWDNKEQGIYVDLISGEALFSSTDKYDSGTGWPSFTKPVKDESVVERKDTGYGMERVEVRGKLSGSHLGHVFDDGLAPANQRYCMNSAALRFIPLTQMESLGYGEYLYLFPDYKKTTVKAAKAVFSAGCFWGVEAYFKRVKGVLKTTAGYTGGTKPDPTYEDVCTGNTGYAESVLIEYDPSAVTYERLLHHFWKIHNPSTLNRQGNDIGTQYRSIIFYFTQEQKLSAEASKNKLSESGKYKDKIVTEILPAQKFWNAEDYHQDYLAKNPGGYCHVDLTDIED